MKPPDRTRGELGRFGDLCRAAERPIRWTVERAPMWWRKREWWLGGCSEEVPDDAQLAANGVFAAMQHPQLGRIETVESLIQLRGVVRRPPSVPPEIGEHTLAVLRDLDYGAERIEALRGAGTVRAHEGGA